MTALLYSAGLDSYCIRKLYNPEKYVVCDPGTREAAIERQIIKEQDIDFEYVDMSFLAQFQDENMTIPFRNSFFVMAAANYDYDVMVGITASDIESWVPDMTYEWASATEAVLNIFADAYRRYRVLTPAKKHTKGQLVRNTVKETDTDYETILKQTKSCHHGTKERGCGECFSCLLRAVSFIARDFTDADVVLEYFEENPFEEVYQQEPRETADDFARRRSSYEDFILSANKIGYDVDEIPEVSDVVSVT